MNKEDKEELQSEQKDVKIKARNTAKAQADLKAGQTRLESAQVLIQKDMADRFEEIQSSINESSTKILDTLAGEREGFKGLAKGGVS